MDSFSYEVERDKKSGEIENTTRQLELIRHRIHIIGKDEDYILSTLFG